MREHLIGRFLIGCMAVGFLCLAGAVAAAAWVTAQNQEHTFWVNHTYEVGLAIDKARIGVEQAETLRRGYVLTQQQAYADNYVLTSAAIPQAIAHIAMLTRDNPRQQVRIAQVRRIQAEIKQYRDQTIALVRAGKTDQAIAIIKDETTARRMKGLRDTFDAMLAEERALLRQRDVQQQESVRLFYGVLIGAGVLLLLVAIFSLATVLRYTRDLTSSRDSLKALADSLEDVVTERTADLTRANEEIQRFAYIVSHDLRSPLVNVMGFTAELDAATTPLKELIDRAEERAPDIVTEEARVAAREDLPEAIGFIRTSTQKMDRLINAILRLSREGRRTILAEPLDMDALVGNVGDTLKHRMDELHLAFTVHHPLPPFVSDRLAVEQIFANLIENAIKYRAPGRTPTIDVSGRREGSRVLFEVKDNGRGIDPRDHQRVFDLFRRSGVQDQPGEGIGLAHVRALAYRLGGVIDVRSELDRGATFRLSLPTTPPKPQDDAA